jgi:hypothetical protein
LANSIAIATGRAFVAAYRAEPFRLIITDLSAVAELVERLCAEAEATGRRDRPGWRTDARAGWLGRKLGSPSAAALAANKPKSRVSAAVTPSPFPQRMRRRSAPSPRPR